jgi:hypothetical protein
LPYADTLPQGLQYDESEITYVLRAERQQAVGFDDDEMNAARKQAMNYYKGVMPDMESLPNRSSVVSTDVADAIESLLPDIIDIFLAGEDGLTFAAVGPEDEDAAKQETDYVRHVIFQQNKGFNLLYTGFKDAFLSRIGVFKFYFDATPEYQEYETEASELGLQELQQLGVEVISAEPSRMVETQMGPMPLFQVTARKMVRNGQVRVEAIPPEDFAVSPDTVDLCDTSYCAYRRRVRVQELLADGYDAEKVSTLRADETNDTFGVARDIAYENDDLELHNAAIEELRVVEVIEHYIRADFEGQGRPQIWRIVTGNNEECILEIEKRARIEFAAGTPYPQTHRFYGLSVADKQIEIQRVKTALNRMLLDSGYFAHNQRPEVDMSKALPETIPALLDNQPGRPVPVKQSGAINAIQTAPVSFDILGALEYFNTVAEQRTGIMRFSQGLNPDTLHDTKGGAVIQLSAAQKRVRMMARQFAEGWIRDLFLGVHDLLRSNATVSDTVRLRNEWVQIDPSSWGRRKDLTIDIGIGSGGREDRFQRLTAFSERIAQIVELQGGLNGPLVSAANVYSLADQLGTVLDIKGVERFITDPEQAEPQEEGPGPEEQKAQAEMQMMQMKLQMQQQEAQLKMQLEQKKAEFDAQLQAAKLQADQQAMRERAQLEAELAREKAMFEADMARQRMQMETQLARERMQVEAELKAQATAVNASVRLTEQSLPAHRPGGDLDK